MTSHTTSPKITPLARERIEEILARNNVGRIAFSVHDRVDIEPINYVFTHGWIYGRTSQGTKLQAISTNRWVAFEVDEVEGLFQWRSVVVHGAVYLLTPDSPPAERHSFEQGIALLRDLLPNTLLANDPVPYRSMVFRIHLDEVTGVESIPSVE
jgi:nitroimidazol reductase NimA-like FMN-containing flavoprotein (pyridoxamine 5'-phosphate oxidase superfamily)